MLMLRVGIRAFFVPIVLIVSSWSLLHAHNDADARHEILTALEMGTVGHTLSGAHLRCLPLEDLQAIYTAIEHELALFKRVLIRESELIRDGFITFYHGQRRCYAFQEDLTIALVRELVRRGLVKEVPEEFLFIQNEQKIVGVPGSMSMWFAECIARGNHHLMMQGLGPEEQVRPSPRRLSANIFLFGNQYRHNSCTMWFFLHNNNRYVHGINIERDICWPFDVDYQEFGSAIHALHDRYEQLFAHGRLLQIAIPRHSVDRFAYVAKPGADRCIIRGAVGKRIAMIADFVEYIWSGAYRAMTVRDIDRIQITIPLTQAGALSPYSGIKVIPYDSQPLSYELYAQYEQDLAQLVVRMVDQIATSWSSGVRELIGRNLG